MFRGILVIGIVVELAIYTVEMCTYIKERQRSLIVHSAGAGVAVSPPAVTVVS